jgi:hypothetical protein
VTIASGLERGQEFINRTIFNHPNYVQSDDNHQMTNNTASTTPVRSSTCSAVLASMLFLSLAEPPCNSTPKDKDLGASRLADIETR